MVTLKKVKQDVLGGKIKKLDQINHGPAS